MMGNTNTYSCNVSQNTYSTILTLKHLDHSFQNVILFSDAVHYHCNIFVWNWFNAMDTWSALWIPMAWCCSTRTSVATVLSTHPAVYELTWSYSQIWALVHGMARWRYGRTSPTGYAHTPKGRDQMDAVRTTGYAARELVEFCWFILGMLGVPWHHIDGLVQDCSISSVSALEILQSCIKPSIPKKLEKIFSDYIRRQWIH